MTLLLPAAVLLLSAVTPICAQVAGQFSLEKPEFAQGEPVFLDFRLLNEGKEAALIWPINQQQPACSGILISASSDRVSTASCPSFAGQMCYTGGPLPVPQPLPPGQTYTARFLLNFDHGVDAPGTYWVEAKRVTFPDHTGDTQTRLSFVVGEDLLPAARLPPWVEQLKSPEWEKRMEAARVLASTAPPSLENLLLTFADDPAFRSLVPLAFHRLNTPRSIEAMAHLVEGPFANEVTDAAKYLAETNDQRWYPVLYDAAVKHAQISSFPAYAAELGGKTMIPTLLALEKSPDEEFTRLNATMAFGYTGSRDAIPILLHLLADPNADVSDRARVGLQLLTHRIAAPDTEYPDRPAEVRKWSRWWQRDGARARIYKATECGNFDPLP